MNPELQRYLWLELTPHRLVAAPVILAGIFTLVWLGSNGDALDHMGTVAYWVVIAVGVLWGARATSEAVTSEVLEGTWDQQRLSSLSPWSMTWAKLAGAPAFTWYVCAPCLALVAIGGATRMAPADAAAHALLLGLVILFAQAMGLLASLHLASREAPLARRSALGLHVVGLVTAVPPLLYSVNAYHQGWGGPVVWFGSEWHPGAFVFLSVGAFAAWTVVGCLRLMGAELQLRNTPLAWTGFVVFCMAYAAGWAWHDGRAPATVIEINGVEVVDASLLCAHGVALALGYGMLFLERKDPVSLRRMLADLGRGSVREALEGLPLWTLTLPLAGAVTAALIVDGSPAATLGASSLVFFARDAGIVMFLNLGRRRARADAAALLYLVLLYGLVPAILAAATGVSMAGWLFPDVAGGVLPGMSSGAVQAVAVWLLVAARWTRAWAGPPAAG